MDISQGVFWTDQVSRDKVWIPASELMRAYHRDVRESLQAGIEVGVPLQMQHDMHRLVGWSRPLGLYIDSTMVQSLGQTETPTDKDEKARLEAFVGRYWSHRFREEARPFQDELEARLAPSNLADIQFLTMESVVAFRPGLAAELYPDLFRPESGLVDKDGLADYRDLLRRMRQVQPGVFHDPERDVLLFAHRFFRRSLSHRNKLNAYFLECFGAVAKEHGGLRARLKLDPDIVGHPSSARMMVEREYWHGPKYSDDISAIPPGVSEHKASDRDRHFHGIDRTQFWWKFPETRGLGGEGVGFRTFEMEELVENESWGLGSNKFGCRYAHAEFSADQAAITHFDGAIRAYPADSYFARIDTSIDKAGKHSEYSKLFRFDGELPISDWKSLLTHYFQGNLLIPEYLGAPSDEDESFDSESDREERAPLPDDAVLAALISLRPGSIRSVMALIPELRQQWGEEFVPYVEVGVGAVEDFLRARLNLEMITTIGIEDGILNLSRVCFGDSSEGDALFELVIKGIALALRKDFEAGLVRRAAIPLAWNIGDLIITLTFAGEAGRVADMLFALPSLVDRSREPAEWIEALSEMVKNAGPRGSTSIIWNGVTRGVLEIARAGVVEQRIRMPNSVQQRLIASGNLMIDVTASK